MKVCKNVNYILFLWFVECLNCVIIYLIWYEALEWGDDFSLLHQNSPVPVYLFITAPLFSSFKLFYFGFWVLRFVICVFLAYFVIQQRRFYGCHFSFQIRLLMNFDLLLFFSAFVEELSSPLDKSQFTPSFTVSFI